MGLADRMARFLESGKAKLALSLHATTDEVGRGLCKAQIRSDTGAVCLTWSAMTYIMLDTPDTPDASYSIMAA